MVTSDAHLLLPCIKPRLSRSRRHLSRQRPVQVAEAREDLPTQASDDQVSNNIFYFVC